MGAEPAAVQHDALADGLARSIVGGERRIDVVMGVERFRERLRIAAYNAARQPIGERIMLHGRRLGTHLGVDLKTDEDRRMWKVLQEDDAMMDWIAVPNFLAAYR